MKTILIPTDFSAVSKNAIHYGIEMAKVHQARIVLFHVYQLPIIMGEIPVALPPLDEIEADCLSSLEKIKKQLIAKYGNDLEIICRSKAGFITDTISSIAEEIKADLIVVGMQGAGFVKEKIMGSNATRLIQESKIPVLVIDKHAHYQSIKNILFASDYHKLQNKKTLTPLLHLIQTFKAKLHILHVVQQKEQAQTITKAVEGIKLNRYFEEVDPEFHFVESENVLDGIHKFLKKNHMDIIVMIPRHHSFIDKLIHEPQSKQVAFHTHLPLLTIHE